MNSAVLTCPRCCDHQAKIGITFAQMKALEETNKTVVDSAKKKVRANMRAGWTDEKNARLILFFSCLSSLPCKVDALHYQRECSLGRFLAHFACAHLALPFRVLRGHHNQGCNDGHSPQQLRSAHPGQTQRGIDCRKDSPDRRGVLGSVSGSRWAAASAHASAAGAAAAGLRSSSAAPCRRRAAPEHNAQQPLGARESRRTFSRGQRKVRSRLCVRAAHRGRTHASGPGRAREWP